MSQISSALDQFHRDKLTIEAQSRSAKSLDHQRKKQIADEFLAQTEPLLSSLLARVIRSGKRLVGIQARWNAALEPEIVRQVVKPRSWLESIWFEISGVYHSGVAREGVFWLNTWDSCDTPAGTPLNSQAIVIIYPEELCDYRINKAFVLDPLAAMVIRIDQRLRVTYSTSGDCRSQIIVSWGE